MRRILIVSVLVLACVGTAFGDTGLAAGRHPAPGDPSPQYGCSLKQQWSQSALMREAALAPIDRADRALDVQHVELFLAVTDTLNFIRGTMFARIVVLEDTRRIALDFRSETAGSSGMTVLRAEAEGEVTTFTHAADTLAIDLPELVVAGDTTSVFVSYQGRPLAGSGPGFGFRLSNYLDEEFASDEDRPVLQTLSEPVSARTWWPCHDHPADAATVRLTVEMPEHLDLAAPGIRELDELIGGGQRRRSNFMPTPIPSYLVSLIVAELEHWSDETTVSELRGDGSIVDRTLPLEYYAPLPRVADAQYSWQNTAAMMSTFEGLFGPYPYADIKYGNALFAGVIAMEHPTLSSMGDSPFVVSSFESTLYDGPAGDLVNAHELAHQWFGDCVRVQRWGDIWLNEGFARYAEVLWIEDFYGENQARAYLDLIRRDAFSGTLRDPSPQSLFGSTIYDKGAWTLHMLRQVLGRDGLISAMRNYVTDPTLRFGAVRIEDFQFHCEAEYGASLAWFFEPWMNRIGRPELEVEWTTLAGGVRLEVSQDPDRSYELPLPVRLFRADGGSEDHVVWVGRGPIEAIETPSEVIHVVVDPDRNWLLDVDTPSRPPVRIGSVVPNPFNPRAKISFVVDGDRFVRLDVYDLRGRHVRELRREFTEAGVYEAIWDGTDAGSQLVASGVYYLRLEGGGTVESRPITLLK